jgi:DNA-binding Lrp family transcriptional regulator
MARTEVQPKQVAKLPVSWLSEGMLKTSILLRHEAARTGNTSEALTYLLHDKLPTKRILAAFPSLDRPDDEVASKASYDYSRCILARSIDEVYRKVTPKYRNEAARRQFFKRLAHAAEAINLPESNAHLMEIFDAHSGDDDIRNWISIELEKLILQKTDLASEYEAKLNAARTEFAIALRQLENLVGISWPESDHYRPLLRILSFFPPGIVENENTWRWGSQWYPQQGILNINPPILLISPIRRGILTREAACLLSPRNLDTMGHNGLELCEQSEYLAYRLFERKTDKEFWSEARHGMRQKTRFRAHELIDFFHYYEMMVGDSLYSELWSRLKESGDARLTFSDYLNIFSSLTSRPVNPRFDERELRLLGLLCKRPDVGAGEAARLLRVSIPTAMKAIRDLSRKAGLTFTVLVDMRKIGLIEHLVTIEATKSAHVLGILSRFPYCRQVFRTYGSFELFCVLDLPFEHDDFAEKFLDRMVERDLIASYKLLHLSRDLQAVNFEAYDAQKQEWDVHWDSWGLNLRESLARPNRFTTERSSQDSELQFDKLDQNILSILHINCRTPFSAIGRNLGVSGAYVGRRVTKMVRQGLVRYSVWPMKIGAEEWGLVALSCTRDVADTLAQSLSKLPAWRGGMVEGAFEGLLAIVWCPNGELRQFFKAIDDRLVKTGLAVAHGLNSIGEWPVARWLPVDPDDPWKLFGDNGKWLFDADRYMALAGQ